jgi:hypothetical protein
MPQSFGIRARAGVVGMLKLASKFAMDIFPSVIATIVGAYIVNHYINNKTPAADTAAAVSTADPKKAASKTDSKPIERSADLGNVPGVRAKGISEKSISDKAAADKATVEKPADKADRPAETASIPPTTPADTRRHGPTAREKAASKPNPAPAAEPVAAVPVTAPAAEPAATPDANDLARAAIERLRGGEPSFRVQESARTPKVVEPKSVEPKAAEPAAVAVAPVAPAPVPVATAPSIQPLPPPIMVSTPPAENKPVAARGNDPLHPTPPADIPEPQNAPLDLRADAADQPPAKRPSVADDVLSATKKLFNSVIPK